MKVRFYRWYNAVLTALLSMLGYSCSSDDIMDEYGVPVEYGCPYASYVVKGTITDEAGTPIQDIRVSAPYGSQFDSQYAQIVQTDAQGTFTLNEFSTLRGVEILVEDIDGEANGGEFQSDIISVETLPKTQVEKDERWYEGKFEATANIKLKKK